MKKLMIACFLLATTVFYSSRIAAQATTCPCDGYMKSLTVRYAGVDSVNINVYKSSTFTSNNLLTTFTNVQNGQILTVNGPGGGQLNFYTYFKIGGTYVRLTTSCSQAIFNQFYSPYWVIGYTDGADNECTLQSIVCLEPAAWSQCTPPASGYDKNVTANGSVTWSSLIGTSNGYQSDNMSKKVKITGTGTVTVSNLNLKLISGGLLVVDGPTLIVNNGNFILDGSSKAIIKNGVLRTYGNIQQTPGTYLCITDTDVEVGEEQADGLFNTTGNTRTSANFQNDGGKRYLKNVCMNVTHDYQLQSTAGGEDRLVFVWAEIGDEGNTHVRTGNLDGDDSGNFQNSSIMRIYGSQFIVAENVQNESSGAMTTCDVSFRTINGHLQNSKLIVGAALCVWVDDGHLIQDNGGMWDVIWENRRGQVSGNIPNIPPNASAASISDCFTNQCVFCPVACDDGDPCTIGECLGGFCFFTPINCDDDNSCTTDDCVNGVCRNIQIDCGDGNSCTADICVPGVGCTHTQTTCNDNNPCTIDICVISNDDDDGDDDDDGSDDDDDGVPGNDDDDGSGDDDDGTADNDDDSGSDDDDDGSGDDDDGTNGNDNDDGSGDDDDGASDNDDDSANRSGSDDDDDGNGDDDDGNTGNDDDDGSGDDDDGTSDNDDDDEGGDDDDDGNGDDDDDMTGNDDDDDGMCVYTPINCDDDNSCTTDDCVNRECRHTQIDCGDGNSCTADFCVPGAGCTHATAGCNDDDLCTTDLCVISHDDDDGDDDDDGSDDDDDGVPGNDDDDGHGDDDDGTADNDDDSGNDDDDDGSGDDDDGNNGNDNDDGSGDDDDGTADNDDDSANRSGSDDDDDGNGDDDDGSTGNDDDDGSGDDDDGTSDNDDDDDGGDDDDDGNGDDDDDMVGNDDDDDGVCVFTPRVCNDNNNCTIDVCDPQTGSCSFSPKCDIDNLCVISTCDPITGNCAAVSKCPPVFDLCFETTCDPLTGNCIQIPIDCNDGDPCTVDICIPGSGCNTTPTNLNVDVNGQNPSACDICDGSATAAPSGGTPPYSFSWSTGATTQSIGGAAPFNGTVKCINAGTGPQFTASTGDIFLVDQNFSGGGTFTNAVAVAGTTDDVLYHTERNTGSNVVGASLTYSIPVINGQYDVSLYFAEMFFGVSNFPVGSSAPYANLRKFDVSIEGVQVLNDYDINAEVGPATAVIKTFLATVADGNLTIVFTNVMNRGKVNALCVKPHQTPGSGSGLCSGQYSVTVTDANSCTATDLINLSNENCDDGDPCTIDVCDNNECFYAIIDCHDGNGCTLDQCVNGECQFTVITCNDGNACTLDQCINGQCQYTPISCNDGNSCTVDQCVNGQCQNTVITCNDGNACTLDQCINGQCQFNTITCNDGNACTLDQCVNGQCQNTVITCNDGNACTIDQCINGQCQYTPISCNDGNTCTTDQCVNGQCQYTPITCNDGNSCTTDQCVNGQCQYTPITCNDGNACTTDRCVNGQCQYTPITCNDGNACTTDQCVNGQCQYTPITCNDGNACTTDRCVNGQCQYTPITCNDGNACTTDQCVNGQCQYTPVVVNVNISKTDVSCDCQTNQLCILDFAGLPHGTILGEQYAAFGIHISALANIPGADAAIVFNTFSTGTPDSDLEIDIGNLAIIPANVTDNNPANGLVDAPNDNNTGGTLTILFDSPRTIESFVFVDKEDEVAFAVAYDALNVPIGFGTIQPTGDGSVQTVPMNVSGVRKLVFTYANSGGVTDIIFGDCECCDGTATAVASGGTQPYTYSWTTGATTASISDLCPGSYTVTATDKNGCTKTNSVVIGEDECIPCDNGICNDNNPCTVDVCIDGECIYTPIACNDNNSCTSDACSNGQCVYTPIPGCGGCPNAVSSLTLVRPGTGGDVATLTNGYEINYETLCRGFNIRANVCAPTVKSVRFVLNGSTFRTESTAPFALNGDNSGSYTAWTPAPGSYTLQVIPYTGTGATGTAGTSLTITFTVVGGTSCNDQDACTTDACPTNGICTHTPIPNCGSDPCANVICNDHNTCTNDVCQNGQCVYANIPGCGDPCYGIVCNDNNSCTNDICYYGSCQYLPIQNCNPCYGVVCNDNNECTNDLCVSGSCTYTPISGCGSCPNAVTSLTLVKPGTGGDVTTLTNGYEINYESLCRGFSIRANACTATVKSVRFVLNGSTFRTESSAPFTLNGDNGGSYTAWTPAAGSYTLQVIPFTGTGGSGTAGTSLTITFTVVGGTSCNDQNACTTDACNNSTSTCTHTPIPNCGSNPCANVVCNDYNACTTDACANGQCTYTPIPGCGNPCYNVNCNDGNSCTNDVCVNGQCQYTPIVCNDNNSCTSDACSNGQCVYTPIQGCGGDPCAASFCDDLNPCTVDVGNGLGGCTHAFVVNTPNYLRVVNTTVNSMNLKILYGSTSSWVNQNVSAGGNNMLCITLRDATTIPGTMSKVHIRLKGSLNSEENRITHYYPVGCVPRGWTTICIPFSAFPLTDFTALPYVEIFNSAAGAYELHILKIEFTGGTTPFVWFGDSHTNNYVSGNSAAFYAQLVTGGPCNGGAKMSQDGLGNSAVVSFNTEVSNLDVFPNPFNDKLNVNFESSVEGKAEIRMVDMLGQIVMTDKVEFMAGENQTTISLDGRFADGMYFLEFRTGGDKVEYVKLYKSR